MYQSFSVISLQPIFAENKILISTSFDVDPTSVDESTIQLFSKAHKTESNIDFQVEGKLITVLITEDVVPNTDYIIKISGIKTILGDDLDAGVRRTLTFKSAVREIPLIISPSNYEELVDLKVTLKAILEDKEYDITADKTYFIQIAEDVAFINIVLETSTEESTVDLKNLKVGQYYIRARVEAINEDIGKDYGKWSETITFISINKSVIDEPEDPVDLNDPEYIEDVELIGIPIHGETPESILLEFSGPIDIDTVDNIVVIRRDI